MSGSKGSKSPSKNEVPSATSGAERELPIDKYDWEKRLAVARVQRERALKSKNKARQKTAVKPPSFMTKDKNDTWIVANTSEEPQTSDFGDAAVRPTPDSVPDTISDQLVTDPPTPKTGLAEGSVGWIAFFAGLGAGIALSFATAVGMGWVQFGAYPQAPLDADAPKVAAVDQQPEAASALGVSAEIAVSVSGASASTDVQPGKTAFSAPTRAALPLPLVKPEATLVELAPGTDALEFRADFQPIVITTAFKNPTSTSERPAALVLDASDRDKLPVLSKPNQVISFLGVDRLSPSPARVAPITHVSLGDDAPSSASLPLLYASAPDVALEAMSSAPEKVSALDSLLEHLSVSQPDLSGPDVMLPSMSGARAALKPSAPLIAHQAAFQLPAVGETRLQVVSLAEELANGGIPAERVRLVTFAPTSIADPAVARHAQFLEDTGLYSDGVSRVNYDVSRTHLRYYNQSDAEVAAAIADRMSADARDFTAFRRPPQPGRIEIYLQGERLEIPRVATAAQ